MSELQKWENYADLDQQLRNELERLSITEKKQRFSKQLLFGTAGIRGLMGVGSDRLNIYTVQKITYGLAQYLLKKKSNSPLKVAIAYDSRNMSKEFSEHCANVLSSLKIKVYVYDELKPTPMLSFLLRDKKCDAGIMITASHNPKEYNGYKVYNQFGAQINIKQADEIAKQIQQTKIGFELKYNRNDDLIEYVQKKYDQKYLDAINLGIYNQGSKKNLKITFTPLHGTSATIIPQVLTQHNFMNLDCVEQQMKPDGNFTNTKSSNPEDETAYEKAKMSAKKFNSDIIVANDPDADRLGVMYKTSENNYQLLNGNEIAVLMVDYLLKYQAVNFKKPIIYKSIVSGDLVKKLAKPHNIDVFETLTGFKFIGEEIEKNQQNQFLFGFEESLGYLINPCVRDKDAIQAVTLMAYVAEENLKNGLTIGQRLKQLYEKYGFYYEKTYSLVVKDVQKNQQILNYFQKIDVKKNNFLKMKKKIDYQHDKTGLPKAQVIKLYLQNDSWIAVRASGTEPKLKIYISTINETLKKAKSENQELFEKITKLISQIN